MKRTTTTILLAWMFLHYDPALRKPGLKALSFETAAACDEVRLRFYNKYVVAYGWASFLHNKGWWVSPSCEFKSVR